MMVRIVLLEIQDILDLGPAECIDGLGIVTDHTKVLMELAQFLENQILGEVGVLVLVHHYVSETPGNRFKSSRIIPQQDIHIQKDIIKVHHSGLPAFLGIELVDVTYPRFLRRRIVLKRRRIPSICLRRHEVVLRHRYARKHIPRLIYLFIKMKVLQTRLDRTDGVACVIYRKSLRISQ